MPPRQASKQSVAAAEQLVPHGDGNDVGVGVRIQRDVCVHAVRLLVWSSRVDQQRRLQRPSDTGRCPHIGLCKDNMGGYQNHGPLLDPYYNTAPKI